MSDEGAARREHLAEVVADRQVQRLRRRGSRRRKMLDRLVERYPAAMSLADDVQAVAQADAAFVECLQRIDWEEKRRDVGAALRRMVGGERQRDIDGRRIVLQWDGERGVFWSDDNELRWRAGDDVARIDVDGVIEPVSVAAESGAAHKEEVTYPIIFTHAVEANHGAVARTIGWALVIDAARDWLSESESPVAIILRGRDEDIEIEEHSEVSPQNLLEPESFGFREEGDLMRRLRDFEHDDPGAHWGRWQRERKNRDFGSWTLQHRGGTRVRMEADSGLRRLRVVERAASTVVRKRHHVFVDAHQPRRQDRYFATEEALCEALEATMKERIEEGFRIVDPVGEGR